jgi:hypothetical protein
MEQRDAITGDVPQRDWNDKSFGTIRAPNVAIIRRLVTSKKADSFPHKLQP